MTHTPSAARHCERCGGFLTENGHCNNCRARPLDGPHVGHLVDRLKDPAVVRAPLGPRAESRRWTELDFDHVEAAQWQAAGFGPDSASTWRDCDFEPTEAERWSRSRADSGSGEWFDPATAAAWRDGGFDSPVEAAMWLDAGHTPDQARHWRVRGFHELEPGWWQQIGVEDPRLAKRWANAGFTPSRAGRWRSAGWEVPEDAGEWQYWGFHPVEASRLRLAGLAPRTAATQRLAGRLRREGLHDAASAAASDNHTL